MFMVGNKEISTEHNQKSPKEKKIKLLFCHEIVFVLYEEKKYFLM